MAAGFGICYLYDWKGTELTNIIPVLVLGIGVDDMFVICNALDQSPFKKSTKERFIECMRHAGPSITITSLTDALAFISGTTS